MELLISFLIAFGVVTSSEKESLLDNPSTVESIYSKSGLSESDYEAYKKKIIEIEQDGI